MLLTWCDKCVCNFKLEWIHIYAGADLVQRTIVYKHSPNFLQDSGRRGGGGGGHIDIRPKTRIGVRLYTCYSYYSTTGVISSG